MRYTQQQLYELLPAIYRIRDAEQAEPLKALLKVIADQAQALQENLSQLYDDQFVETCAPWVLPYIGDLLGITGLPGTKLQALNPRAEVAHTIGYRRRKGTAAVLEQLARDVSGWPARAVEFFQLIAATQYMNHLRPENQSFTSVRGAERLEYLGGAFERAAAEGNSDLTHTVDVRRISKGHGRYNIPNVGLFLWRLRPISLTRSPAVGAGVGDRRRFFFNPLGIDAPLFNLPVTESDIAHLAEPINVPDRIRRRVLARNLDDYYGVGKSLLLETAEQDIRIEPTAIQSSEIIVCDLTDWTNLPTDKIAIDPVLGRIAFPKDQTQNLLVTFHYGFSAYLGGGEYSRLTTADTRRTEVLDSQGNPVRKKVVNTYFKDAIAQNVRFATIHDALADLGPKGGTVEIVNSGRYSESLAIHAADQRIELRAADKRRPILVLLSDLEITGGENDEVLLDGLLIAGGGLRIGGKLGRLRLRHCTIVPAKTASLIVGSEGSRVEIDHCIMGGIEATRDTEVIVRNSIIDVTAETSTAYAGPGSDFGAPLRITNSTVIGLVRTSTMRLASNTIFLGNVLVERRQEGCVRFCYLPPDARVPVRYHCQPQTADSFVRPQFVSTHFRDPAYCQLLASCPPEIRRGADDESEMGAFHDLFEPQREAHLRLRIDEYLRFGLEAGLFYVT